MRPWHLSMLPLVLTGCAGRHNWLASAGAEAQAVEDLFWVLILGAAVIWSLVIGLAIYAHQTSAPRKSDRALVLVYYSSKCPASYKG